MMTAIALAAATAAAAGTGTWLVPWDAYDAGEPGAACFGELNPFVYAFDESGRPKLLDGGLLRKTLERRPAGAKVVPVIVNDIVDGKNRMKDAKSIALLEKLLASDRAVDKHVKTLMSTVWSDEFDGLEIDYERIPPSLYPRFARLLEKLGAELHARGKYLAVDLEPAPIVKRGGPGPRWWPEFAKHADALKLMVYYETGSFSDAPGPGASLPWSRKIAEKALEAVPPGRLMLVFSLAGTEWPVPYSRGGKVKRLHYKQVKALLDAQAASPSYDETLGAPKFAYAEGGASREVWFEDERSLKAKLELARSLGVRAGLWYLGRAHPDLNSLGLCRP